VANAVWPNPIEAPSVSASNSERKFMLTPFQSCWVERITEFCRGGRTRYRPQARRRSRNSCGFRL